MALTGLQPFEQANVYDNTVTAQEGRDPASWGTPNDPSHGILGSGDTVTPASGFNMAPGDEFAFGDIDAYLDGDQHGHVLDQTFYQPDGVGVSVAVPVTGYGTPHNPAHWEYEAELREAHQDDQGGPLRSRFVNPLHQGTENVQAWPMYATNRGATLGGPKESNGALVSTPGSSRPALDNSTHNRAKMLRSPYIDYGERPWFNNVAAVAAASDPVTGNSPSPSNRYPVLILNDPGPGVVYESPPDPQMAPASASTQAPGGLEWMTYG